jgi:hypothetical protein
VVPGEENGHDSLAANRTPQRVTTEEDRKTPSWAGLGAARSASSRSAGEEGNNSDGATNSSRQSNSNEGNAHAQPDSDARAKGTRHGRGRGEAAGSEGGRRAGPESGWPHCAKATVDGMVVPATAPSSTLPLVDDCSPPVVVVVCLLAPVRSAVVCGSGSAAAAEARRSTGTRGQRGWEAPRKGRGARRTRGPWAGVGRACCSAVCVCAGRPRAVPPLTGRRRLRVSRRSLRKEGRSGGLARRAEQSRSNQPPMNAHRHRQV